MILVDANLLLYAKLSSFPEHPRAHRWLDGKLNGADRVGLPWPSLLAFLRLSTNTRLFPRPLTMAAAWQQVREWIALETTWLPTPGEEHEEVLDRLLRPGGITPKLVMDAHLAALAIEHGLALCSADADFARFGDLRWVNPLGE
ncbi:MAG TPA: type II toxin-antitoxin system VapC family toxin [Thermoanaerobaculia bacterium]|nr:type II toxin-antitoxin system VapC family toxin [Thermoanaerobaculia bacterium]